MYFRDTISISKINAAFLTGQQINRIHVQQLLFTMFVCKPYNTQRLLLYHEPSNSSIDPYAKKEPDFSWDVPIDILKSTLIALNKHHLIVYNKKCDRYAIGVQ